MSLLRNLKTNLYHRRIRNHLHEMGTKVILPVNQSFDIGILMLLDEKKNLDNYTHFIQWLKQRDRNIETIVFNPFKVPWQNSIYQILDRKNNDWLEIPKTEDVLDFCNRKMDLLINFDHQSNKTLEFIASISKASFKIGLSESTYKAYDVLLETQDYSDYNKITEIKKLVKHLSQ